MKNTNFCGKRNREEMSDGMNDDVLACVGSFLSGMNSSVVKQTKFLLDMIE
jgi:hypothetical protein